MEPTAAPVSQIIESDNTFDKISPLIKLILIALHIYFIAESIDKRSLARNIQAGKTKVQTKPGRRNKLSRSKHIKRIRLSRNTMCKNIQLSEETLENYNAVVKSYFNEALENKSKSEMQFNK